MEYKNGKTFVNLRLHLDGQSPPASQYPSPPAERPGHFVNAVFPDMIWLKQKQLQMMLQLHKTLNQLRKKLPPLLSHEPVRLLYKLCLSSKKLLCKLLALSLPLPMQLCKLIDNSHKTKVFFTIALAMELQKLFLLLL